MASCFQAAAWGLLLLLVTPEHLSDRMVGAAGSFSSVSAFGTYLSLHHTQLVVWPDQGC